MRWNEDQTVTFVKIYLQHEYLWNRKHGHYGIKYLRKKAYKEISSLFEDTTGIKLMEIEVMNKIKSLGSTYTQELAKIKKSSEPYEPSMKWFYYWYRCKHDNQPVSLDSVITFDDISVLPDAKNDFNSSCSHTKKWVEDETLEFVKIYSQYEVLWNPKHAYYRNNEERKKAYRKICSQFETATGIALSEKEVSMKINSLKSTYRQERMKISRLSNPDFAYVSRLKWFADWDKCYNTRYSNEEAETGASESDDQKIWLELSNDDDEDAVPKQSKSEETWIRTRWNETDTLKFVKIYLQYEFLYNPRHEYFRQNKLRQEGYASVISEFAAATGIKLDENELKNKIKSLGSTYAQELAKIRKKSNSDLPYSPKIKWFKYWHRHKYSMQQRNAGNSVDDTQEPVDDSPESTFEEDEVDAKFEEEEQKSLESHSDSESECDMKKRKIEKPENQEDTFSINFVDANSDSVWREDEFEHYGRYIASVLRSMDLEKALRTQLEIQNLLSVARQDTA